MPTFKLLLSQEAIAERVRRLADEITRFYEDLEVDNPVLVPVLDGSLVFCADLMRAIRLDVEVCPVTVKSYQGTESGAITHGPLPNVPNRCVLIIEDVVDTGNTLRHLMRGLIGQGALHIATCVFLDKRKVADFAPDRKSVV